jgi:sugar-specific transcriptional regulator TrmB
MDESDAIDAMEELGLTRYEAQVFIALQQLGIASASEIGQATDVPRSQVYGTAESLEERGLVEIQQSNPIRYRPVGLEEAQQTLREQYEMYQRKAFDYLESVRQQRPRGAEQQEDIWTVRGSDHIEKRVQQLATDATEHVVYGCGEALLDEQTAETLVGRADQGVDVTVMSRDETVRSRFTDTGVGTLAFPSEVDSPRNQAGRVLSADGDTILLSVLGASVTSSVPEETAIWSSGTGFAVTFTLLLSSWFEMHLGRAVL